MLNAVRNHCESILTTCCNELPFHNFEHTKEVVDNVQIIGEHLEMPPEELEPVLIAAWFHDTGFSKKYKGHEDVSIELAKEFLEKHGYPHLKIDVALSSIKATKMPQSPKNLYDSILSDADISHLGTSKFFYRKLLLRREWEIVLEKFVSDYEWHALNLEFLRKHHFFTSYGTDVLMRGQRENEAKVKNLVRIYEPR